ncbi:TIR domain-containing protein [Pseudomonas koreensis]|uniref:toll/interleukin-1 receptor domain-containing protein n=1 Tax=Pseudomonas koreensis TaxID=198620 RepID=UPI0021C5AB8E|nr:TIR domain-containing protein [Pseudomonas koreensis]MCU0091939.1 TIR domain-containing protein [Pseudomonas koreensis]
MTHDTCPFLVIYVVWHPFFSEGPEIAETLRQHFRRNLYENVAGGAGVSVIFRSAVSPDAEVPISIDLDEAHSTAVVILVDENLSTNQAWIEYVQELAVRTEKKGLGARIFPVSFNQKVLARLNIEEQALRWDRWQGTKPEQLQLLTSSLTYQFCRMLRHYLEHLKRPSEDEEALEAYLKKVQIFLSHSKHDDKGEEIAYAIRDRLHAGNGLAGFFDVHDIPAGLKFNKVLLQQVKVSAMVAIHTDSYSSREWCRREIIEAKRWSVPLVIANSLNDLDERGFPYMGNVPVVRLDTDDNRINFVIGRLLDEVLKDFLWRCQVIIFQDNTMKNVFFVPRPPELISLAILPPEIETPDPIIVYPDPPLSKEEQRLFEEICPRVQLRSLNEWLAGAAQ